MITVDRVTRRFGRITAVDDVSLAIPAGQVVGILGPNGAGKSTTIRMITGALPPSAGRVAVDGFDSIASTMKVRCRLGYLPENNPLYPEMRVAAYLRHRAGLYGMRGSAGRRAVAEAMDRCWLTDVRRRRIGQLSKGYRQRVGLAAALVHNPPVLILDEPTSGLDPSQIAETRRLIRDLAGARTMLIVSHILPEVEKTCDRIIVFARGRVRADGAPADLIARAADRGGDASEWILQARPAAAGTPAPTGIAQALAAIRGLTVEQVRTNADGWTSATIRSTLRDAGEAIGRAASDHGLIIRELRPATVSLEQLYIRVVEDADRVEEAGEPAAATATRGEPAA